MGCSATLTTAGKVHMCDWPGPHDGFGHHSDTARATWTGAAELETENADLRRQLDVMRADVEKLRRGGRTLGEIIDKQSRELIELTDSQDIIGEDGDGDWAVVWDRLHEMKAANTNLWERLREVIRERDEARALVVRSGLFERLDCDCVFTRHESDLCGALTEEELAEAGVDTDHSIGQEPLYDQRWNSDHEIGD